MRTDGRTRGRTDGRTDGHADGRTGGRTDGQKGYDANADKRDKMRMRTKSGLFHCPNIIRYFGDTIHRLKYTVNSSWSFSRLPKMHCNFILVSICKVIENCAGSPRSKIPLRWC